VQAALSTETVTRQSRRIVCITLKVKLCEQDVGLAPVPIPSLFKADVSNSDYIAFTDWMLVNNEL
jgi:hypothetical protein